MCHPDRFLPIAGGAGMIEEIVEIPGEGAPLPSYFVRLDNGPAPAVLIIHDVFGPNDFYHDVARRLGGEGFAALLPDYFARQGPLPDQTREAALARGSQLDEPTALADIAHTQRWLIQHSGTIGDVGIIGFCMGGTLALLAAGRDPVSGAAVAYYGFPAGRQGWPHRPLDEVERLQAPVLAFWGDQDHGAGMENVAEYQRATRDAAKSTEIVIYPGLPHGFLKFDPDAPHFDDAQDSWQRTLEFLRKHLVA